MGIKKTGISLDLIFHPGETIAEILEERNISQTELAARTGVTPAYVSSIISGKKDISAGFAMSLEYALGVDKQFWLNLQANYEAELMEYNKEHSITEEEKDVRKKLVSVVSYLRSVNSLPERESITDSIISLRSFFKVSSLCNLKDLVPSGAFRLATNAYVDPYILGAWLAICQNNANPNICTEFDSDKTDHLINELKAIMTSNPNNLVEELSTVMQKYGIDFSLLHNFRGAPVNGYICQKSDNCYQMALTIRGAFADIFWFSLFHELGHIVNGDVTKSQKFIDLDRIETNREKMANLFASSALIDPHAYERFISQNDFSIVSIKRFANNQNVMPYIVIGRLQKEKRIPYSWYSEYKLRYKWAE